MGLAAYVSELFGHVAALWHGGGIVMPSLFCAAFVLWTTLGSRMLRLRRGPAGPLPALLRAQLADPGRPVAGILGEALRRGADAWRRRGGPVPDIELEVLFSDLEDTLGAGTSLARVLVAMAPLLGLLGTVTGLIETFGSLGASATSTDSEGIAGGIVVALYATQMGLAIAVPGLLAGGILHHREQRLRSELGELIELLGGAHDAQEAA